MAAAKKATPIAALAVFGKPKGGDKPPAGGPMMEEEPASEGTEEAELDEAGVIFDEAAPLESKAAALKEFIRLCTKGGY